MTWTTTTFGTLINLSLYARLAVKRPDRAADCEAVVMAYGGPDGDQRVLYRGTRAECEAALAHVGRLLDAYDLSHVPANGNGRRELAGAGA